MVRWIYYRCFCGRCYRQALLSNEAWVLGPEETLDALPAGAWFHDHYDCSVCRARKAAKNE